jgi:hypothetical protein
MIEKRLLANMKIKTKINTMKYFLILMLGAALFASCKNKTEDQSAVTDTATAAKTNDTVIKEIGPSFSNVNPKVSGYMKAIVDDYLQLKNALIDDNGSDAANAAEKMKAQLATVDKSLFTAEQKKVYDDVEEELKEHAEHIEKNGSKIEHQREHFSMMSEVMYDLVKSFGGGQPLYHDHCPMANDNKGGMWLSETKEVKNPYFAGKMNDCVTVPEVIK